MKNKLPAPAIGNRKGRPKNLFNIVKTHTKTHGKLSSLNRFFLAYKGNDSSELPFALQYLAELATVRQDIAKAIYHESVGICVLNKNLKHFLAPVFKASPESLVTIRGQGKPTDKAIPPPTNPNSGNPEYDWLLYLGRNQIMEVMQIFISAFERKDAAFFHALAERLEKGIPAEKTFHAMAETAAYHPGKMWPLTELQKHLKDTYQVQIDDRQLSHCAKILNILIKKPGRPKKR
jgi:hypothetical protein